jgi:ribosomal protein S18 acetylase RimI-like enzyme
VPSAPAIAVRPATRADLAALGRLAALLVRMHHDFDPQRFMPATPRTQHGYASWLGSQLEEKTAIVLVAERAGEVVGYTYSGVEGPDWMALRGPAVVLHDIVVDPAHRRQGVGRALLEATIAALEARRVPRVVLHTAARNEAAHGLFEQAGFRRTMIEMTRERGGDGAGTGPGRASAP